LNIFRALPIAPEQASEHAWRYDLLYWTITALSVFFGAIVVVMILVFVTKYRREKVVDRSNPPYHNTGLELLWSGVPLVLAVAIFCWSAYNFVRFQRTMPKEGIEVYVIGKRWMWHLQHMNGIRENNELHVPVGTPVKMTMISQDVIHAMYLPDFRAQFHVVPGRYTELAFTPTKVGRFKMLCAMHCGTQHSEMVGFVHVLSKKDFAEWMANGGNRYEDVPLSMAEAGRQVWQQKNCGNCHGVRDSVRGPSLHGIFGSQRPMADGSTALADSAYLRDAILEPWRQLTKGYDATMPEYKGQLSEEQVLRLIAYMKSLGMVEPDGKLAPYEPELPGRRSFSSAPQNATDMSNKNASAGMTQSQQGGTN
jgi:cytochrome c oxidase subunit II